MKPMIVPIAEDLARPFVLEYARRWGVKIDEDSAMEYGQAVMWLGAWYKNTLRAVAGLLVADEIPDELFVYGFYGDGSVYEKRPIRALLEMVDRLPYEHKYGYIQIENKNMVRAAEHFGWQVTRKEHNKEYGEMLRVEAHNG